MAENLERISGIRTLSGSRDTLVEVGAALSKVAGVVIVHGGLGGVNGECTGLTWHGVWLI